MVAYAEVENIWLFFASGEAFLGNTNVVAFSLNGIPVCALDYQTSRASDPTLRKIKIYHDVPGGRVYSYDLTDPSPGTVVLGGPLAPAAPQ
jgi:hypothetical protein